MISLKGPKSGPLKILHCFRAVEGGLFRHVRDLADLQVAAGHRVGLICDRGPYSDLEESRLAALTPRLLLGAHRLPVPRGIGLGDIGAIAKTAHIIDQTRPDIIHGHGAKGGLMARLGGQWARHRRMSRLYCPHGGSLWFDGKSLTGKLYFLTERLQERYTDTIVCVAAASAKTYRQKIHDTKVPITIVYNGLHADELKPVKRADDAADFLTIGALRHLKGIDLFLDALSQVKTPDGRPATAIIVGNGEERAKYVAQAEALGLAQRVRFLPPAPARQMFMRARVNVMASRSESMPYMALETLGAKMPLVATKVGGIPEIYGPYADLLVTPDNAAALAIGMQNALAKADGKQPEIEQLHHRISQEFSVTAMANAMEQVYRHAITRRCDPVFERTNSTADLSGVDG